MTSFIEKLITTSDANQSLLCVGLDPNPQRYPDHFPQGTDAAGLTAWGRQIIEQTVDMVCCYKPNIAFYEQFGPAGLEALQQTIAAIPDQIPVLLDAKRGDIGSTAEAYARAAFEILGADAVTVNPYLGRDGVAPFLAYPGKMAFLLCYTSNPSAGEIQLYGRDGAPLFEQVARQGQRWGDESQIGFVIGATRPDALARFRALNPAQTYWVLAPGVGAQGGDLAAALQAGLNAQGRGLIVPVSRAVLYAPDPRAAADSLRRQMAAVDPPASPEGEVWVEWLELVQWLYDNDCIQFGQFTLASGKQSPIYIDLRRITANPILLERVAQAYARLIQSLPFDHLAAVPYAALTIGAAVALTSQKPLIYPRKEAKSYGARKMVEGAFSPGDRAVVIEDLVTSGGSVLNAIDTLTGAGLTVSDVVVLIDREQGGRDNLAAAGYRLHAAFTMTEILTLLQRSDAISAVEVENVMAYLKS